MILSEKLSNSTSVETPLMVPTVFFDGAGNDSARAKFPSIVNELLKLRKAVVVRSPLYNSTGLVLSRLAIRWPKGIRTVARTVATAPLPIVPR
jgi:hypothetical protein